MFIRLFLVLCTLLSLGCSLNNVSIDNSLKKHFDSARVDGTFAMFDNGRGQFTIYNIKRDTTRYLPASTFKIFNALVAIETGVVSDDSTLIKWDGIARSNPNWNKDLILRDAFRYSSYPHFMELARRIGRDTMQKYLDTVKYGNRKIGARPDSFWLDNSLKISPDEELGFVKRLYFDQLPFRKGTQGVVRSMMLQEENNNYSLSYKTGWGFNEQGRSIGWLVGWIVENNHPYFFVLNIETPDRNLDISAVRLNIFRGIMDQLGFFKGKM